MTKAVACQFNVFQNSKVRSAIHKEEMLFSAVDVVGVLTDSPNPSRYWADLKRNNLSVSMEGIEILRKIQILKLPSGMYNKKYKTDCASREMIEKIIQNIPALDLYSIKKNKNKIKRKSGVGALSLIRRDTQSYQMIENIFNSCPYGFVVDHIIPLKGENVCGLNVPWNLQIVPREYNASKSNKYNPEFYTEQADRSLEFYNIVTQAIISEHSRKNIIDFYEEKGKKDLRKILQNKTYPLTNIIH